MKTITIEKCVKCEKKFHYIPISEKHDMLCSNCFHKLLKEKDLLW